VLTIDIQRLHPDAVLPTYAHDGDAAFDLLALEDITLEPGERKQIRTGLAMHIPKGYVGLIWEKSGLSHLHGLIILGGVIDAGYLGEVLIGMANLSSTPYTFTKGQKAAQMIVQQREAVSFREVETFTQTSRGSGGFGSSGR
jgi:dUTP pyrophosphatase